ncbi:MAG: Fic family protein [Propionibacteriaceae bacterium]|jgi:Fic family protein|nr:Fic family protein [Propionibacteriaceae bacterium]
MRIEDYYTESPQWHQLVGEIHALLERVRISEEQHSDVLRLRKMNRILSVHSSTAIEGNRLTLSEVSDVINDRPVWGPPKDILEVRNAWAAYDMLPELDPWSVQSLLDAHRRLTDGLIDESGAFRSVAVAVVRGDGFVLHRGAPAADVPGLVAELLQAAQVSEVHPLILSSVVHFMLEHIHPFRDGNGRIGRLWQTLILAQWNPEFAWMPVETMVHHNQPSYYRVLQESHSGDVVGCAPFITFMLGAIRDALQQYVVLATETTEDDADVGVNVGVNVGVREQILQHLSVDPTLSARELATLIGKTPRTVERHLEALRSSGKLRRVGSDKTGHWELLTDQTGGEA